MIRIGHGYDTHRFAAGRKLILGGVEIPHELGMEAHSDGDVIIHAICDAFLGAVALGDIGQHFPNNDPNYRNIDSRVLLQRVIELVHQQGFWIANIDVSVLAEQPKLAKYIPAMRETLACDMQIAVTQVSVKATTTEKMGAIGRSEGIAAYAVVLVQSL